MVPLMPQMTSSPQEVLSQVVSRLAPDCVCVLCDTQTAVHCLPLVRGALGEQTTVITLPEGESHKTLDSVARVWRALHDCGATRHSLLVNLGGGVVTDLGGFAAATYKRGMRFVHIPTTLLAMVDASVGGKTGFDFDGLKNQIGVFCDAAAVIVSPVFLRTLPAPYLMAGYAEMLKHGLLSSCEQWSALLSEVDVDFSTPAFLDSLAESIGIKQQYVALDPRDQGHRKALNLGHTVAHALEALLLDRGTPCQHGHAVAWGLVAALYISHATLGLSCDVLRLTTRFVREHYAPLPIGCNDYDALIAFMRHDKKNVGQDIAFTLLRDFADVAVHQVVTPALIAEALDFMRDAG